jgi:homocysteine S-methyltransferase
VHASFFEAGADVATTATYQASRDGFAKAGLSVERADELTRLGVQLAVRARDDWWAAYQAAHAQHGGGDRGRGRTGPRRLRPLVAASVGPYGAARADGSEYRGQYCEEEAAAGASAAEGASAAARGPPLTAAWLAAWHLPRLALLAQCPGVDLLACETVPSLVEVREQVVDSELFVRFHMPNH